MQKTYNYFYKITNNINNHYYYGIHSTNNLNDGYMGSGKRLHAAYKKYGIENFSKEILKFFATRKEASDYENEMVTESVVERSECYNIVVGGESLNTIGKSVVLDRKTNTYKLIKTSEYRDNKDKYVGVTNGMVIAKDIITNKYHAVRKDEYHSNKENFVTPTTGFVIVKDNKNNIFRVKKDDERYLAGELTKVWKDRRHSDETKQRMSATHAINKHQQGEKNSHYNTCWVTKDGINKCIKKYELEIYKSEGWEKGRTLHLSTDKISSLNKEEIINLRNNGFTWLDIAKKVGVNETTIYKFKKKNNI